MSTLPTGTVTFYFSDIEGSTRLIHELGADAASAFAEGQAMSLAEAVAYALGGAVRTTPVRP